jgi:DNA-binding NarL/FixJ family response regulator
VADGPLARHDEQATETLTARERAVLGELARGVPNKTIAARLGISEHTVKFHVASIFAKLAVSSRTEAVARGARLGLVML